MATIDEFKSMVAAAAETPRAKWKSFYELSISTGIQEAKAIVISVKAANDSVNLKNGKIDIRLYKNGASTGAGINISYEESRWIELHLKELYDADDESKMMTTKNKNRKLTIELCALTGKKGKYFLITDQGVEQGEKARKLAIMFHHATTIIANLSYVNDMVAFVDFADRIGTGKEQTGYLLHLVYRTIIGFKPFGEVSEAGELIAKFKEERTLNWIRAIMNFFGYGTSFETRFIQPNNDQIEKAFDAAITKEWDATNLSRAVYLMTEYAVTCN